jgi:hypothetical protein
LKIISIIVFNDAPDKNFEIADIDILADKKYHVKCLSFPVKIVSVENWLAVIKKLHDNQKPYKDKIRFTDTQMSTGIITCPYCQLKYYFLIKNNVQASYQHFSKKSCHQLPKSMKVEIIDNIFSVFYFYFYLVFDDTKNLIKENQKIMKINLAEIREKIKAAEIANRKIDKQIDNISSVFETETDKQLLKLSLTKENALNIKKEKNIDTLNKLKSELDDLNKKYNADDLTLTYYSVEQNIIDFFEKMTVNEKRASLIRIIKNCQLFHNYLVIDTGNILFVFNVKDKIELPQSVYNRFKTDKHFRTNFLYSGELLDKHGNFQANIQELLDMPIAEARKKYTQDQILLLQNKVLHWLVARRIENIVINEYNLSQTDDKKYIEKQLTKIGIKYKVTDINKIISFTDDV